MDNNITKKSLQKTMATKTIKYLTLGVPLFILICILVILLSKSDEANRVDTIQIGNQIVESLDRYWSMNGRYPESLNKLGEVSKPKWGEGWIYNCLEDGDMYVLITGHKKRNGSYGPALYYNKTKDNSSGWLYYDQDTSIEMK